MKSKYLLCCLFFALQIHCIAQFTQVVRGKVIDKETQQSLPGAVVQIIGNNPIIATTSNETGNFKLLSVPVGRQNILVTYIGYTNFTIQQIVTSGKEIVLQIELEEQFSQIKEVVINASVDKSKSSNELATVSARQFSIEEANRYAGSFNDPSRMASNYAGVSLTSDVRNDIVIRGNSPFGLLWRLEGMDVPSPNHFSTSGVSGGAVSILNNNLLANSNFYTSAFPAEYSNGLSGVFDIKLRNGNNEKHELVAQVGFNGFEGNVEGPLSKKSGASYLVGYRYSVFTFLKALGINYGVTAVPSYQDLTFKLNFPFKKGVFSLFGVGGLGTSNILGSEVKPTDFLGRKNFNLYFKSGMGSGGANLIYNVSDNSYFKTVIATTYDGSTILLDSLFSNKVERFRTEINTKYKTGIHSFLNTKLSSRFSYRIGLQYDHINYVSTNTRFYAFNPLIAPNVVFDAKGNANLARAYVATNFKLSKSLTLNTGLSYMHFLLNNTNSVEPRIGIAWQLRPSHRISLAYGLHGRFQELAIYYIKSNTKNGIEENNKKLKPTKSHQSVLAYDWNINENWRIKSEAYFQYLFNVPIEQSKSSFSMINAGADFALPYVDSLENKGFGRNYGIELTLEKFIQKGFYALITTSIFKSEYKTNTNIWYQSAFDANYMFNVLIGKEWTLNDKITLLADFKYTTTGGRRYIPIDTAITKAIGAIYYNQSQAYSAQLKRYERVDFKIGVRQNFKKVSHELAISVTNLLNRKNIFSIDYNEVNKELYYTYQLQLVPLLLYKINF